MFGRVADPGLLPDTILRREVSGAVYVLKGFDEGVVRFAGEPTAAALSRFIERHSLPLVAELDRRPESRAILRRGVRAPRPESDCICRSRHGGGRQRENIVTALREVAASGETEFRSSWAKRRKTPAALQYFASLRSSPRGSCHDTETDKKYAARGKPQDIAGWLAKYDRGFLNPSLKSESEPPARAQCGAVQMVMSPSPSSAW